LWWKGFRLSAGALDSLPMTTLSRAAELRRIHSQPGAAGGDAVKSLPCSILYYAAFSSPSIPKPRMASA
jgi:hypothetical protein